MTSKHFIKLLKAEGLEPVGYSGRGMFGRTCVAVHGRTVASVLMCVPRLKEVGEPSTDALGKGVIVYWPSMPWSD